MNSGNIIQVKTPGGLTDRAETGDNFAQGSAGAALVSSLNLDCVITDQFTGSQHELHYGQVRLQPLIYQDDPARGCDNVVSAQAGNDKIVSVIKSKQLELNLDKSCYLLLGNLQHIKKVRQQIKEIPLIIDGCKMNINSE